MVFIFINLPECSLCLKSPQVDSMRSKSRKSSFPSFSFLLLTFIFSTSWKSSSLANILVSILIRNLFPVYFIPIEPAAFDPNKFSSQLTLYAADIVYLFGSSGIGCLFGFTYVFGSYVIIDSST